MIHKSNVFRFSGVWFKAAIIFQSVFLLSGCAALAQQGGGSPLFVKLSAGWASLGTGSAFGYGVGVDFSKMVPNGAKSAAGAWQVGGELIFESGANSPSEADRLNMRNPGWYEHRAQVSVWPKGTYYPVRRGFFKGIYGSFGPTVGFKQMLTERSLSFADMGGGFIERRSRMERVENVTAGLRLSFGFDVPVNAQWLLGFRADWALTGGYNDALLGARLTYVLH
ncbi:MAG: hypothetical protein MUF62_08580 [Chitinophagaceae bacterium]|nr:hypothetical protein [Chitinophagaceae bacterium]